MGGLPGYSKSYDYLGSHFSLLAAGTPRTLSVLDFPTNLVQGPRGHHQAALYQLATPTGIYCVSDRRCRDRDRRETTLDR